MSIICGIKKFHKYLYGRTFTLITDHTPLVTILGPKTAVPTLAALRIQRWALMLQAYTHEIDTGSRRKRRCIVALATAWGESHRGVWNLPSVVCSRFTYRRFGHCRENTSRSSVVASTRVCTHWAAKSCG